MIPIHIRCTSKAQREYVSYSVTAVYRVICEEIRVSGTVGATETRQEAKTPSSSLRKCYEVEVASCSIRWRDFITWRRETINIHKSVRGGRTSSIHVPPLCHPDRPYNNKLKNSYSLSDLQPLGKTRHGILKGQFDPNLIAARRRQIQEALGLLLMTDLNAVGKFFGMDFCKFLADRSLERGGWRVGNVLTPKEEQALAEQNSYMRRYISVQSSVCMPAVTLVLAICVGSLLAVSPWPHHSESWHWPFSLQLIIDLFSFGRASVILGFFSTVLIGWRFIHANQPWANQRGDKYSFNDSAEGSGESGGMINEDRNRELDCTARSQKKATFDDLDIEIEASTTAAECLTHEEAQRVLSLADDSEAALLELASITTAKQFKEKGFVLETKGDDLEVWSRRQLNGVKLWHASGPIRGYFAKDVYRLIATVVGHTKWNPTLWEYQTLCTVNACTDVVYAAAAPECGGLVSSRDFITTRRVARRGISVAPGESEQQCFISGGCSIEMQSCGTKPGRVRGVNGVSGFVAIEEAGEEPLTRMVYVINSDLKGWLSIRLIELAITTVIAKFYRAVKAELDCRRWERGGKSSST